MTSLWTTPSTARLVDAGGRRVHDDSDTTVLWSGEPPAPTPGMHLLSFIGAPLAKSVARSFNEQMQRGNKIISEGLRTDNVKIDTSRFADDASFYAQQAVTGVFNVAL